MKLPFARAGARVVLLGPRSLAFDTSLLWIAHVVGKVHRAALRDLWIGASESPYVTALSYSRFYNSDVFARITNPYTSVKFLRRHL